MPLEAIRRIDLTSLLDSTVSLAAAFLLGGLIGLERQYRQRTAGLRTNVLVAVGSAIFVDMANRLHELEGGSQGALTVTAYVVSGVGFLGAGVIMRGENHVRGLNTAATLWGSAAVGACAGADLLLEAVLGTVFVLAANTLLRPIVDRINRSPREIASVERMLRLVAICSKPEQPSAIARVSETLEQAGYPMVDFVVRPFGPSEIEIVANVGAMRLDRQELDSILSRINRAPTVVRQVYWSSE